MSPQNKTGLRVAAAGAAAALTLAVGAPVFAQETTPATDATEAPAAENTETPAPETTETPAAEATEDPAAEAPGSDSEVADDKDPAVEEVPEAEVPNEELPELGEGEEEDFGSFYSYMYIDEVLQNADNGETVEAHPEFYIEEAPENPDDVAATVLVFNDSTSLDSIVNGEEWELTYHAWAYAPYDNCNVWEWGITCVITDFEGESDTTYGLDNPLYFDIIDEVDDNDGAPYYAVDVDDATLDAVLAEGYYDLETDNQLGLTEIEPSEGSEWWYDFGLFYFEAGQPLPDVPTAEQPGNGGGQLPTTGNSSIILISSAAAALLAGAVVFFMLRRRKAATTWE